MITVKLMGGMGNQMFQYAMGLAVARRLDTRVQLDTSLLGVNRPLALHQWNIDALQLAPRHAATVHEQGMRYNQATVDSIKDGDVLQGYWQSEKYFYDPDALRGEFTPLTWSIRSRDLLKQIFQSNSVAVHVRRGDYLNEPHKSFHGILSDKYYADAMTRIWHERGLSARFFIFSDDIKWVKSNFSSEPFTFVEPGTESEDIYLMSICNHAIIANSSFSWWGAWLGDKQKNRTVIAPAKWFADGSGEDYSDIVPERWIKI
jgi:hypothetical protein